MATSGPKVAFEDIFKDIFSEDGFEFEPFAFEFDPDLALAGGALLPAEIQEQETTQIKVSIRTSTQAAPEPKADHKLKKEKEEDDEDEYVPNDMSEKKTDQIMGLKIEIDKLKKENDLLLYNTSLSKDDSRRERNRISATISRRNKELARLIANTQVGTLKNELIQAKKEIQQLKQANMLLQAENEALKKRLEGTVQETAVVVTVSSPSKKRSYLPLYKSDSALSVGKDTVNEDLIYQKPVVRLNE